MDNPLESLREYDRVAGISGIARRYFAMNVFDGAVTMLGVIGGSWAAGVDNPRVLLTTGLTTSIAMAISGIWGAYLTESAERAREMGKLQLQMLSDLGQTTIGRASRAAVLVVTAVEAASPLLAGGIPLIPFLLVPGVPMRSAYIAGMGLAILVLFVIGVYLGGVAGRNRFVFGLKTLMAGVLAIIVSLIWGVGGS